MRQFIDRHGLTIIFAVGIAVCLSVGWALEHKAFTPASPPGQAFAVVFVQDKSASLSLTATVNPDSPWRDRLTVGVKEAPVRQDHWLLIIGCPPGSAGSPHPGTLVSEPAAQAAAPASSVTVYSGFLEHIWPDLFPRRKHKKKKGLAASEETPSPEPALVHAGPRSKAL